MSPASVDMGTQVFMDDEDYEKHQAKVKKQARLEARQRRDDLRRVMATAEGRRLLHQLIFVDSGLTARSFGGDSHDTAFREGRRALAIELHEELMRDAPVSFLQMLQERLDALPPPEPEEE